jgi:hypothetical protein
MAYTEVDTGTYAGSGTTIKCEQGALLTPSSGAITVTDSFHSINGGTLSTINGGNPNSFYMLEAAASFAISAPTNIRTSKATIVTGDLLTLWFDGSTFIEISTHPSGAVGDGLTDDAAAIQAYISATSVNNVVPLPPTASGYLCKSPLVINQSFTALVGPDYLQTPMTFDLSAYAGALPKYCIILGDSLHDPTAGGGVQGNAVRNLRITAIGATGGILAQRSNLSKIESNVINGAGLTYGIRAIACDSQFTIRDNAIGTVSAATAPTIPISIENGSNQTRVVGNTAIGASASVQVFNSIGVSIDHNPNIGLWVTAASSYYGIKILNDQAVPSWLTWIGPNTGANIHISDNWFEPGDHAGATIYDIYVGSGVPTVHAIPGTVIRDNYFLGTSSATRYPMYIDYADQTVIGPATYWGTVTKLLNITSHASLTKYDLQTQTSFNTSGGVTDALLIADAGTKSVPVGHWKTPAFSAGNFTSDAGTWTVQSGDVLANSYTITNRLLIWSVYLVNTDVATSPTELRVAIPDGYTAVSYARVAICLVDSSTIPFGLAYVAPGDAFVRIKRQDGSAFTNSSGATAAQFQIAFEIT